MRIRSNIGWITLAAVMLLLAACNGTPDAATEPRQQQEQQQEQQEQQEQPEDKKSEDTEEPVEGQPPTALEAAATVMSALKNGNMAAVAAWAHPDKGVRFSPYANVDTKTDLVFTREELQGLMENSKKYEWQTFAGSGEKMEMTYADYHKQFVYDADFIKEGTISYNEGKGQSNLPSNITEVYPKEEYDFVEYYIEGIDPKLEGMDWRSLRLVFEKFGEDRALVGIVHNQWTP